MVQSTYTVDFLTSTENLQALIDTAETGSIIQLQEGTYSFDHTIIVQRSDITVQGMGTGKTVIQMKEELAGEPVFQVGNPMYKTSVMETNNLASIGAEGARTLVLESGHSLEVGQVIYLSQENTEEYLDSIGDDHWRENSSLRQFMVEVESVNGDMVTLKEELPFEFDPDITSVQIHNLVENVSLSGFSIEGPYGESDPSRFSNVEWKSKNASTILVNGTQGITINDVELEDVPSHGLTLDYSLDANVSGLTVDGSHNKGSGGNGYAVWVRNVFSSDFEDLTLTDTRHAVVFGSFNTSVNNSIDVEFTNRDINFHGGRDTGNVVTVQDSLRNSVEQDYMSAVSFFNYGTSYGAPTDREANVLTFENVVGTVRSDEVVAADTGAVIKVMGAADVVHGGAGNDYVELGSGADIYYTSAGIDKVYGGQGGDTVVFSDNMSAYELMWEGKTLIVGSNDGVTYLTSVETVVFADQQVSFYEIAETEEVTCVIKEISVVEHSSVDGGAGWQRIWTDGSAVMGEDLEAIAYGGNDYVELIGNDLNNHVMGGFGADLLEGRDGNDRIVGRSGADVLIGGDGDDKLFGGHGDDTLMGSQGEDLLEGGIGADTFVGTEGDNYVVDFRLSDGDILLFNSGGFAAEAVVEEFFSSGEVTGDLEVREVEVEDTFGLELQWWQESLTLLNYDLSDF